jgi:hypothetical protein
MVLLKEIVIVNEKATSNSLFLMSYKGLAISILIIHTTLFSSFLSPFVHTIHMCSV